MTNTTVTQDIRTLGQQLHEFFDGHSAINAFAVLGERLLFNRIIVDTGRFPTAGEAVTWLARRQARLNSVRDQLDAISDRISIEIARTSLTAFLTPERVEQIKPTLKPIEIQIIENILAALKSTGKESDHMVQNGVFNLPSLLQDGALWNLWLSQRRADATTYRKREKDACLDATLALGSLLDGSDLPFLQEMIRITFDHGGVGGHREFHRLESDRTNDCVQKTIGQDTLYLCPLPEETRKLNRAQSFAELVREIAKDPTRSIETGMEIALASRVGHSQENLTRLSSQTNEKPLDFVYLFHDGMIRDICDKSPFVQEAAFRAILDAFGIDPIADATLVVRRTMRYAGVSEKIGRYFILPRSANRSGTLALLLSDEREPFPFCWYCAGDEENMRQLIHKRTFPANHAEMETLEEMRNTPLEPLPLSTNNPFQDRRWFNPEAISAHIERRRWAAQFAKEARALSELP